MSTQGTPLDGPSPSQPLKPQRVLACILCQQRKIKCNRKFPCENCIKSRAQCVPATQVSRQRRRRFPERELLERLRRYEDLLLQNNIKFEPLHKESIAGKEPPNLKGDSDSDGERPRRAEAEWPSPATTATSDRVRESKYATPRIQAMLHWLNFLRTIWDAMSQGVRLNTV